MPRRARVDLLAVKQVNTACRRIPSWTYTALYTADGDSEAVRVREILPIGDAHTRYGH